MRSRSALPVLTAAALAVAVVQPGSAGAATPGSPAGWSGRALQPSEDLVLDKAMTSSIARTDPTLLHASGTVPVVVKFDYDSLATYAGGVAGYAATSPTVTGHPLRGDADQKRYESYLAGREDAVLGSVRKAAPSAVVGQRLRVVYGGVAMTVAADQIPALVATPGVVAVQRDTLSHPATDASVHFIGADALDSTFGGTATAGKGVIVGSLDTGVWPEHPSFTDTGTLPAPPPKADGTPRTCDFGDNPLTPANDVFRCNDKLIGGQAFLTTYNANNPPELYSSARDSDGHGTHTASTAAGDVLTSTPLLGTDRGPARGVAPGAWISVYKVCGTAGCYGSDSVAAVQQAVLDGVSVINYSIGGGSQPYTDPVELAFLDAYAAGVFVAASAGNDGPDAGTTSHDSPWVTTVGASTQQREFDSTLTLTSGPDSLVLTGGSITRGVSAPLPVVLASAPPYSDATCGHAAPPGLFVGKIVVCARGAGVGRIQKGFDVLQGGAGGMILYNPTPQDVEADNHWLPTVHLADGTQLLAFLAAHGVTTATFTAGAKAQGPGDVMASFSSRGPGGLGIKPDLTAPGVEILAGNTPTPDSIDDGPAGTYFQDIAGTSMASPHIAGSAVLLKALHPAWTPAQIKSALMMTAVTAVTKEDAKTPADPFDDGSGRVTVPPAANPGLTLDETAARMASLGASPLTAIHLNLASIDAPVMPGAVTTTRTFTNVTSSTQRYSVSTTTGQGSAIIVIPSDFTIAAGARRQVSVTILSRAAIGTQQFGQILLTPRSGSGLPQLHIPVAFVPKQGDVTLASSCTPTSIGLSAMSTCTVSAHNTTYTDTTASFTSVTGLGIPVTGATGATRTSPFTVQASGVALSGAKPGVPTVAPGTSPGGYLPLDAFGIAPTPNR